MLLFTEMKLLREMFWNNGGKRELKTKLEIARWVTLKFSGCENLIWDHNAGGTETKHSDFWKIQINSELQFMEVDLANHCSFWKDSFWKEDSQLQTLISF